MQCAPRAEVDPKNRSNTLKIGKCTKSNYFRSTSAPVQMSRKPIKGHAELRRKGAWERHYPKKKYTPYPGRSRQLKTSQELKFLDTLVNDAVVTSTMANTVLNVVPQGDGDSERVGRKITIKKIMVKGSVILSPGSKAQAYNRVLVMLVHDKATNKAQFTGTDLRVTDSIDAYSNLQNANRFQILWAEYIDVNAGGYGGYDAGSLETCEAGQKFEAYVKCSIPCQYSSTTGAIGEMTTGSVHFVSFSQVTNLCEIQGNARIRYVDGH